MPEDLKTKSVLVADNGLFVELAPRLARDFGEVKYFCPWGSAYPKASLAHIGFGLDGVERVTTFWDQVPDADLIVFPDLYFADWAEVCRDRFHKPVWSHFQGEMLELDRWGTRKLQRQMGLPTPKSHFITGLDSLAEYLAVHKDRWVKISAYRGDGETWHHDTFHTTRTYLDHFANKVGALADTYEFLVEEPIEGIEIGYDGWTVHGNFPEASYWGFEIKDQGYIGRFSPYADLPESIRSINDKMAAVLREARSVGFCSFEFRLTTDGTAYMIDPCLRAGSPPFEVTQEGYDNLPEILWEGGHGRLCPPKPLGEFIALALIHSSFALTNWVPIEVPEEDRRWLKLRNAAVLDGELYHMPTYGDMPEIGAVIAASDSLEEAIALVKERALRVKGYNLEIKTDALDKAQEEIERAKDFGVEFL